MRYGFEIAVLMMFLGTIIFLLFPKPLLLFFFNSTEEMLEIGIPMLRITSLCFIPAAIGIMYSTFFQALGYGIYSLIMSILRQMVIILPLAKLLSYISLSEMTALLPHRRNCLRFNGYIVYKKLYNKIFNRRNI